MPLHTCGNCNDDRHADRHTHRHTDGHTMTAYKLKFRLNRSHRNEHSSPPFKNLRILKISDINLLQTSLFMYKLYHNLLPSQFTVYFSLNSNIHSYNTRAHEKHIPSVTINIRQFSIKYYRPQYIIIYRLLEIC